MEVKAEIILGSRNEYGDKIVTWKLTFPIIVLAEFNTHRMISKNSASSRAIPFETLVNRVENAPFIPIKWLKDHKGMQGEDFWESDSREAILAEEIWLKNRDAAVLRAKKLSSLNISKQFVNRLLEPFMWHTVIATGTEWENFFALRAHHMAEIHIQDLAYKMLEEYNKYEFKDLKAGQWHIPFKELINEREVADWTINNNPKTACYQNTQITMAAISAGICAGISYGRIKESIDIEDMIDLHNSLVVRPYKGKRGVREINDPIHASPTEHQAKAMDGDMIFYEEEIMGMSGNFHGFEQYRKMLQNENARDKRVKKD